VIPAGAEAWSAERIGVVLAHECAHIHRGDWAVQIAAELLRRLLVQSLLWLVCRRLRDESERACDDAVLAQGTDATVYAGHLVELARGLQTRTGRCRRLRWLDRAA
jgi:beta-lactamase regulating signal transducer with metallopeptidase domain